MFEKFSEIFFNKTVNWIIIRKKVVYTIFQSFQSLISSKLVMKASHYTVSVEIKVFILIAYVESNFD